MKIQFQLKGLSINMKYKSLWKDTWVEIRKSVGRFLSIFFIVAIGVAFFAGIKAGAPAMKHSADAYFDEQNLMDITVMSTLGLTSEDIDALQDIKGVEGIYASHSMDSLVQVESTQQVFKIMAMPLEAKKNDPNYINIPRLLEGRMPEKENECVVEYDKIVKSEVEIGDTITFSSGTDTAISESLKNDTYKVVGYITSPYYLSHEKGSSTLGSGVINSYAYIIDSNFTSEYYTEAYLRVKNTKQYNAYVEDAYFDTVEKVTKQIEDISEERATLRIDSIKAEAFATLDTKIKEYEDNKTLFETEIANAKNTIQSKENELLANKQTLDAGQKELTTQKANFENNKSSIVSGLTELNNQLVSIKQAIGQLEMALQNPNLPPEQATALQTQLAQAKAGKTQIEAKIAELNATLTNTPILLTQKQAEIDNGYTAIADGEKQIETAKQELATKESDGLEKLNEANELIEKGKTDIEELEAPTWYVLDRHSHYSFMDYGNAADRMDAIATVFPIFFFLVAALVCLTSMTRMVDEQRQQIGTLKALGYNKSSIALKYVGYASIASVFGGIFGAVLGMYIFPYVIYSAWNIMYTLPEEMAFLWRGDLAFIAITSATLTMMATTMLACYKELSETPSLLMRPKAPKNGKKVILERIPFIWKHFSFIYKVTARNILRYKKRFFMTVIGISGCTALIVSGFGIRDSIGSIVEKQFNQIYHYDVSLTLAKSMTTSETNSLLEDIKKEDNIKNAGSIGIYRGLYKEGKEDKNVDLYVIDNAKKADQFYTLKNRQSGEVYSIKDDGILITEKLANEQNLDVGDTFKVDNGDGKQRPLKVKGIVENYVGHNIYMSPTYYKETFKVTAKDTSIIATFKDNDKSHENNFGSKYMQNDNVKSVTFFSGIAESFDNTISSLLMVVIVLIISAGLLAFVVLYNLTTVNISERMREIATIKVLGFYDKEVSSYVYRENIILTIIGSLFGLLLGIGLHSLIMSIAEMEDVMFGRNIEPLSFIYAFVITMGFSIIVNLVMYNKLKRIPMVESLKSVE